MGKMKVYIAAPWPFREEAQQVRRVLEAAGLVVQSQWLDFDPQTKDPHAPEVCRDEALTDLDDINHCDAILVMNNYKVGAYKPSGMFFEEGFAYALGLDVVVVGKGTTVFHSLPDVTVVGDVLEAVKALHDFAQESAS
jgi:nucleoside 2-deoxyribosyltransferase